ncbi:xanthine/uracil permease family protein isoform X2 [Wolffia australiana]
MGEEKAAGSLPTQAPAQGTVPRAPYVPQPREQLAHLHFCIQSNPSWRETFLFAFQHYIVMLGSVVAVSSILVPQMGGNNKDKAQVIQTLLFVSGINTLLQTLVGTRLPTVMNPSFAYLIPVISTMTDFESRNFSGDRQRFRHTMRAIQGSMIVSSIVNIGIGYSGLWGKYARTFTPVSMAPVVCAVGLGLFGRGFPELAKCVEIGLPMLILLLLQQYLKRVHKRVHTWFERFGILFCIAVAWSFAAVLTASGAYNKAKLETQRHCRVDRSYLLASADWVRVPYPFQWGPPSFGASHVFGMMGATLVSAIESTGTHFATARLSGATPPPTRVISRSVGLQGVGLLVEGAFGTLVGSTASVENTGLLGLTKIGSRRAVQLSAAFMVFFSIFGKFGALFASIPLPIFAAIYCILFGIVAAAGVSFVQFTSSDNLRNQYVVGVSLFLAISIPQYFNQFNASAGHGPAHTNAGWFNDILNTLFSSAPVVAMAMATALDRTLDGATADERGLSWWTRFQRTAGDGRNEEFYSFPAAATFIPSRFL